MESLEHNLEALRIIQAFAELPPARLRLVAQAAEEVHFDAGEVIVRQGDPGDAVYALTGTLSTRPGLDLKTRTLICVISAAATGH